MTDKRPVLKVKPRKIAGRKVKRLRKEGFLPASIYGKKFKSKSLKVDLKEAASLLGKVGETGLVDLQIEGEKEKLTVLLKNPQHDPVTDQLIHLDFHKVDLTEKVTAHIPIEFAGHSPIVKRGEALLVQTLDEVEVEALPADLPEKFVVDLSKLEKIDDVFTAGQLKFDAQKIELKTDKNQILVKVEPPAEEEEEPEVKEEAVEGEEITEEKEGIEKEEKKEEAPKKGEKTEPVEKAPSEPEKKE